MLFSEEEPKLSSRSKDSYDRNRLSPEPSTPSTLQPSSTALPLKYPDDHRITVSLQLLLRIASSATDENIENAAQYWRKWQQNYLNENDDTGGAGKKRKNDPVSKIRPEQSYHLEFIFPVDESKEKNVDTDFAKFFVDIIDLHAMAKVYYGRSDNPKHTQVEESPAKLFRYFRREKHTYLYIEVDYDIMLTEAVVRRLATFRLNVDLFESPDKLCARAKADIKNAKKMTLPPFSKPILPAVLEAGLSEFGKNEPHEKIAKDNRRLNLAAEHLYTAYLNNSPSWKRPSVRSLFLHSSEFEPRSPPLQIDSPVPQTPEGTKAKAVNGSKPFKTKSKANDGTKKALTTKQKQDQLNARLLKRQTEASHTPVFHFQGPTSKLFIRGSTITMRGNIHEKVGLENDPTAELVTTIYETLLQIGVRNGEFLNLGQKIRLNPITVSVDSVEDLPEFDTPFSKLREICYPVYVEFSRFGYGTAKTTPQPHERNIVWDEPLVTFCGSFDPELFKEYLSGSPLAFQLHDRDRKDGICENPFGTAKLDLYPLLEYNIKEIELNCPVTPFLNGHVTTKFLPEPSANFLAKAETAEALAEQALKQSRKSVKKRSGKQPTNVKTPVDKDAQAPVHGPKKTKSPTELPAVESLPPGRYQDAKTAIKVTVSVAFPLRDFLRASPRTGLTPFCRYVMIISVNEVSWRFVKTIHHFICCFNAKSLHFSDTRTKSAVENDVMQFRRVVPGAVESTHSVHSAPEDLDKYDVITGFHVVDGQAHILVLEGLYNDGIANFADFVTSRVEQINLERWNILWDSQLQFSSRLYGTFGATTFGLHLDQNLLILASYPYVKMVKHYSAALVQTIHQLRRMAFETKIPRDLSKNQLFPSVEGLLALQSGFGQIYDCSQLTFNSPLLDNNMHED